MTMPIRRMLLRPCKKMRDLAVGGKSLWPTKYWQHQPFDISSPISINPKCFVLRLLVVAPLVSFHTLTWPMISLLTEGPASVQSTKSLVQVWAAIPPRPITNNPSRNCHRRWLTAMFTWQTPSKLDCPWVSVSPIVAYSRKHVVSQSSFSNPN